MHNKEFFDSISPFWIYIRKDGLVESFSKYFQSSLKKQTFITDHFSFKRTFFKDDSDIVYSLNGKAFQVEYIRTGLVFRCILHKDRDHALVSMWPSLININQIMEFNLESEMSHPGAMIKELLISKDIIKRNSEIIKNIELRASEIRYKHLFEQSNDAVMTYSLQSRHFTSANRAALKLFEFNYFEELKDITFVDLSPSCQPCGTPSKELIKKYTSQALSTGGCIFQWNYQTSNKKVSPSMVTLSRIEDDEKVYFQIVVRDISNEKQLEKSLKESNEYLELALSGAGIGIWDWNLLNNKVSFDKRWLGMLGLKENEVEMNLDTWKSRVHPDDLEQVFEDIDKYKRGEVKQYENIHRMQHSSGAWVYILDKGRFSDWDSNGKPIRFTGTHLDITEKIQTEKALMRNAKLASIGELAAGVGHEINNPLSIVRGYTNMILQKGDNLSKDVVDSLEKIDHASHRIQKIVTGLKNFSRIEKNTNENYFNLKNLLCQMENMVRSIYEAEGINLTFKYENLDELICINGDRIKFEQILINLLSNARDATEIKQKRFIVLSAQSISAFATISITDNGSGIEDNLKDKIFDPFFTTKEVGKGTGIGLSLVHSFVTKDFNGEIDIQDSPFDTGTSFVLKVPVVLSNEDIQTAKNITEERSSPKISLKAIIVDDEPAILELLALQLEDIGIKVTTFNDAQEAFEYYFNHSTEYDVILSDIKMPNLDGPEFLKKIRNEKKLKQPKFVFMTGGVNSDLRENIQDVYQGMIEKPFNIDAILEILQEIFPDLT